MKIKLEIYLMVKRFSIWVIQGLCSGSGNYSYNIIIINPRLLPYGVPQTWSTPQFQLHTFTHKKPHKQESKQNKKFQFLATSDFLKSISTPADQCGQDPSHTSNPPQEVTSRITSFISEQTRINFVKFNNKCFIYYSFMACQTQSGSAQCFTPDPAHLFCRI